jgi:MoxR-like ATPase
MGAGAATLEDTILDLGDEEGRAQPPAPRQEVERAAHAPGPLSFSAKSPRPALPPIPGYPSLTQTRIEERAAWWVKRLDEADYFLGEAEALHLTYFVEERNDPLILQGEPGCGKTSLVYALSRVLGGAPVERINCFKGIHVAKLLYGWDPTLQELAIKRAVELAGGEHPPDPTPFIYSSSCMRPGVFARAFRLKHPHTIVLVNEVDKVPEDEEFEAQTLEVIEEHQITVEETGECLRPATGIPPYCIFTSNAGVRGSSNRAALSNPLLRRAIEIDLPTANRERRYDVLRQKAPRLSPEVVKELTLFLEYMRRVNMQKPVALSEGISWARTLQLFLPFKELTPELVNKTIAKLGKSQKDKERLQAGYRDLFTQVNTEKIVWTPRSEMATRRS